MEELVLFLHFTGLMLGAGGGMAAMSAELAHKKLGGGPPSDHLKTVKPIAARISLIGIILLWATGTIMLQDYNVGDLGTLFYIKLLLAFGVFAVNLYSVVKGAAYARAGTPPPASFAKIAKSAAPMAFTAVLLAVIVFA